MGDHRLARPWTDVRPQIEADRGAYDLRETRSPRDFFAVDETSLYAVRAQESGRHTVLTLTPAPARRAPVIAYERALR